jgi:hypothetical protein
VHIQRLVGALHESFVKPNIEGSRPHSRDRPAVISDDESAVAIVVIPKFRFIYINYDEIRLQPRYELFGLRPKIEGRYDEWPALNTAPAVMWLEFRAAQSPGN